MPYYRIADLNVFMDLGGRTAKQALPYLADAPATPDISIHVSAQEIEQVRENNPQLSDDEWEYVLSATKFYRALVDFDGFLLHSSAVIYQGRAFVFSAPSGTGKSTHTALWQQHFGKDCVQILNDDKPAIRWRDGRFYAYGTPWSGKNDISLPTCAPLAGICFLSRAENNSIRRLSSKEALSGLFSQTLRKFDDNKLDHLFELLSLLLCEVPIYQLQCNISTEAAALAERTMNRQSTAPAFQSAVGRHPYLIREGYELVIKAGSNIIACRDDDDFHGLMTLNSTGVFLFRILRGGATREELSSALATEYAIDRATAEADVDRFLLSLKRLDLLIEG